MRSSHSLFVETGDAWRAGDDRSFPYLALDTPTRVGEIALHFGLDSGRTAPSAAVVELEALIAAALELRNSIAADLGRAPMSVRADGPDGPDDPTDEPTDEPLHLYRPGARTGDGLAPCTVCGDAPTTPGFAYTHEPSRRAELDPEVAALRHAGIDA